ncbi:MAG: hypothetical protein WC389_10485 [Lutibacter sp.]
MKKYSKHAMEIHEKHCTMNPNRECRMCVQLSGNQFEMDTLKSYFPDPAEFYLLDDLVNQGGDEFTAMDGETNPEVILLIKHINVAIDKVLEDTEGCPMCTMAVLRQLKIPIPLTTFDYKGVRKNALETIKNQRESYYDQINTGVFL